MASSKEYLEFILGQLSGLNEITYRAMMGEFVIYYRGKIVGGIYDDTQNELQEEQEKLLSEIAELKTPLTEVQADLKKLRDIRYWVRKATPGTEESKEPPKKQPIKEVLQDKADEKKAQRTVPAQTKHKQQDMEL